MSGSSHIQSVLIGVDYRNCHRTLDVCNLVLTEFAQAEEQKVNKHPKFQNNFDI